jgi:hypothetical protein
MTRTIFRDPTGDARATGRRVILPAMRGVIAMGFPQTTAAQAAYNWCDGAAAHTVIGTPTFNDGYISSAVATSRLNTAVYEATAMTFYVVARSSAAFSANTSRPTLIGAFQGQSGGIAGACIQVTGTPSAAPAANVTMYASRDLTGVPTQLGATVAVTDFSAWTLLVGTCDDAMSTSARQIHDMTNGNSAVASVAQATSRVLVSTTELRVCNLTTLSYGALDVGPWIIANVVHTQAEREDNARAIRRRLAAFHPSINP